ncbi:MAG: ABC-type multidrug transport system, permease component [Frankiales bacterium]|nr:ABC-type multidrug transport system, permease component [Frankiales bacterium]
MKQTLILTGRALREARRTPEALAPTLLIPLFFLVVNVGQAGKIFPGKSTPFLHGQGYAGFQLPSSLLVAGSFGSAALFLVEDIEKGYFDRLRAAPVSRVALVMSRLLAESVKSLVLTAVMIAISLLLGVRIATGVGGFLLLLVLTSAWAVVFAGFMQLIALKTRSSAATQSGGLIFFPLLFLTPSFAPRAMLTHPMEVAASCNPVTYIMEGMRALVLGGGDWGRVGLAFAVVAAAGAVMLLLNVRLVKRFD